MSPVALWLDDAWTLARAALPFGWVLEVFAYETWTFVQARSAADDAGPTIEAEAELPAEALVALREKLLEFSYSPVSVR